MKYYSFRSSIYRNNPYAIEINDDEDPIKAIQHEFPRQQPRHIKELREINKIFYNAIMNNWYYNGSH